MPNIFLVDDNQLMRQQALRFLEQQDSFTISGEAVNGKEAISKFPDLLPDITIMDFEMPEMNGLEAAQAILKEYPNANILMLSIHLPGQLAVERSTSFCIVRRGIGPGLGFKSTAARPHRHHFR